ncbi:thiamine pyrophosphate-binding protein [Nesterenkonia flava]|uniref:Thiamine pyrophosphate-binding protein n=1 Tax=Nesterenkonia flava TaxID=469799 RepID=A0ABU1FPN1_9MICC|nr:thiamine pyrophosphate-binding protein [Nesterenkonia flava]MDR5710605.1 thiamine pyrophosphate-binding protein [Nesterenkonia flava]
MTEQTMTVAQAVGTALAELGSSHIFGVVGSGNFHMTNAMIAAGVGFTAARHEMGAACMADGYARSTGKLTVVSVHQGCGLTNSLTGVTEASKSGSPVIVLSGDTPGWNPGSNFYIDQDAVVRGLGAVAARVHRPETVWQDVTTAVRTAVHERRTVVLSVPLDIQEQQAPPRPPEGLRLLPVVPAGASPEAIEELASALLAAERPVIVAGRGALHAKQELQAVAGRVGALLTTSAVARGLFADDDWYLDAMGGFATDGTAELIGEADLLVAFGASLNRWTTRSGYLLRGKKVIQVDDRPQAFGFHFDIDLPVLGDSRHIAQALDASLASRGTGPKMGYRREDIREKVRRSRHWCEQPFDDTSTDTEIDPRLLTVELDRKLPDHRVVIPDGGNFNCYPAMLFRVPDNTGYCLGLAFQSIGLSLAMGIGASVALPDRLPIVGIGDGGFMMSHVELDTAVRLGKRMVVVVYNDHAYSAEVHHFVHETDHLDTVIFPETDIASIARGYGCEAVTVRTKEDLSAVDEWLNSDKAVPLVIDARITSFPSWVLAHSFEGPE